MSDHALRYKARALKQKRKAIHDAARKFIKDEPMRLEYRHVDDAHLNLIGCYAVDPKDWDELVRAVENG